MTPTLIELVDCPEGGTLGFGNCEAPATVWDAEGGAFGVFTDGVAVYPSDEIMTGACCYDDGHCQFRHMDYCSGLFLPGESCYPNPCVQPLLRACCDDQQNCTLTYEYDCDGTWLADEPYCYNPNPCLPSPADEQSWGEIKTLYR